MSRYAEVSESGGLTLGELRRFLRVVDSMDFSEDTRLRVRAAFGNTRGARLKEISIDDKDRIEERT